MTEREKQFAIINETQEYYENQLIKEILNPNNVLKEIYFTSPTGTGKTKMSIETMDKLNEASISKNEDSEYYFLITTLSKGQLDSQISSEFEKRAKYDNYLVYGVSKFTKNTKLTGEEILSKIPNDKKLIWFRDEGHIASNNWSKLLENKCFKIVNFSATNKYEGITCNFTHTMMLRTVKQYPGSKPIDALKKLIEIKNEHASIKSYNPCCIMRILDEVILNNAIKECEELNLKYINITDDNYDMSDICNDDNEYDVIFNKFKLVEGIDLRRAHVIYFDNQPGNAATTIQAIGRCRRNALLYRNDIDILEPINKKLLEDTRICYAFYNADKMKIDEDENGELTSAFCDIISVEKIKTGSHIVLENGVMNNGLTIIEANGESGEFDVIRDSELGFNILNPLTSFYEASLNKNKSKIIIDTIQKDWCRDFSGKMENIYHVVDSKINKCEYLKKTICYGGYSIYITFENLKEIYEFNKNADSVKIRKRRTKELSLEIEFYDFDNFYNFNNINGCLKKRKKIINSKEGLLQVEEFIGESDYNQLINSNGIRYHFYRNCFLERCCLIYAYNNENDKRLIATHKSFEGIFNNYVLDIINNITDKELAIIGCDTTKYSKHNNSFILDKNVTSKIRTNSKFNSFISNKFKDILNPSSNYYFQKNNYYGFNKKCNTMLGFVVEYTAKLLLTGDYNINNYEDKAKLIRKAIVEYSENMKLVYGKEVSHKIPRLSLEKLMEKAQENFVNISYDLALKVRNFIKELSPNYKHDLNPDSIKLTNLITKNIVGVADFIVDDTIIELKCTNELNERYMKQLLSYYYLAIKKGLEINKLILFDAISGKYILIDMCNEKVTNGLYKQEIDFNIYFNKNEENNKIIKKENHEIEKFKTQCRHEIPCYKSENDECNSYYSVSFEKIYNKEYSDINYDFIPSESVKILYNDKNYFERFILNPDLNEKSVLTPEEKIFFFAKKHFAFKVHINEAKLISYFPLTSFSRLKDLDVYLYDFELSYFNRMYEADYNVEIIFAFDMKRIDKCMDYKEFNLHLNNELTIKKSQLNKFNYLAARFYHSLIAFISFFDKEDIIEINPNEIKLKDSNYVEYLNYKIFHYEMEHIINK